MELATNSIEVYLEIGKKRTFAGAIDWPGWCRAGRDEQSALQALFDYGPRYARVLRSSGLEFEAPAELSAFHIVERLEGNATTDFGAPDMATSSDTEPVSGEDLQRFRALLQACWRAFDEAAQEAAGKELRKGPRGGGRDLERMIQHVLGADSGYLSSLGWKYKNGEAGDLAGELRQTRQAILEALTPPALEGIPAIGPRGGLRWTPRYFVRRSAWHVLDHAWEIEERLLV
jgi:hypothetical protein